MHAVAHALLAGALAALCVWLLETYWSHAWAPLPGLRLLIALSAAAAAAIATWRTAAVPRRRPAACRRAELTDQPVAPSTSDRARTARSGWSANTPSTPVRTTDVNHRSQSPCAATSPPRRSGAGRNRFSGRSVQV